MTELPDSQKFGNQPQDGLESRLQAAARVFPFPPTPDVSRIVSRRLSPVHPRRSWRALAVIGVLAVLFLAAVLAVPPVRAALLEWIRIGAVRIFLVEPTRTPTPTRPPELSATPPPTELPSSTPLSSILDLAGETTLADAQARSGFPIRLPAYPAGLGKPDHVFFQDLGAQAVILVWMDQAHPDQVRLSITETGSESIFFQKMAPLSIENTTVNGQPAVWVDSPYFLITGAGDMEYVRLVKEGHTLVWTAGAMSYRLETGSDLASAVRLAESLRPEP